MLELQQEVLESIYSVQVLVLSALRAGASHTVQIRHVNKVALKTTNTRHLRRQAAKKGVGGPSSASRVLLNAFLEEACGIGAREKF